MAARFAFMALRSGAAVSGSVGGGFSPGLPITPPAPLTSDLSTVTVFLSDLPFLMASSRALRSAIALTLADHDTTSASEERRTRARTGCTKRHRSWYSVHQVSGCSLWICTTRVIFGTLLRTAPRVRVGGRGILF